MATEKIYDLLIIGGGINGCGIAADAAVRGLSVGLCEQNDLANFTSSASTKLIHGGLRYLEHYQFRLVKEALAEREVLQKIAPHLVQPLSIIIPHNQRQRSRWLIRAGLFLYDHLGYGMRRRSSLAKSRYLKLDSLPNNPINESMSNGFCYADCRVDDSRLVIANAQLAAHHQADIMTRSKVISVKREDQYWQICTTGADGEQTFLARAIVNAAGPWVQQLLDDTLPVTRSHTIQLVKGSHIVVPKMYAGEQAYLLQNYDKRVIFVIPYCQDYTLIGTTDVVYHGDPAAAQITTEEINYLCQAVNDYFVQPIRTEDIVHTWSGVRPLSADDNADPAAMSRDYLLDVSDTEGKHPLLSVFGGKITTYRKLAKRALQQLSPYFPSLKQAAVTPLAGANLPADTLDDFIQQLQNDYPWLARELLQRWGFAYGSNVYQILKTSKQIIDLGEHFGFSLYQIEVDYLWQHEWARTAQDILWRRSKLGLRFSTEQVTALAQYLTTKS